MPESNMPDRAIVLFAHGARDPQWAEPLMQLKSMLEARVGGSAVVELSFLELMKPDLPSVVQCMAAGGVKRVDIIPVFFGRGGHLKKDFPVILEGLCKSYPDMTIQATEAVGQWDAMWEALADEAARRLS